MRVLEPISIKSSLSRYERQATKLIEAYRFGDEQALCYIRQHHPRLAGRANTNDRNGVTAANIRKVRVNPADARCVVARWHGFESFLALERYVEAVADRSSEVLQFESAVEAILDGKVGTLKALLRRNPALVRARSMREHRATLLHYVSANGVEQYRQRTPKNIVEVARVLLKAGSEADADLDYGAGNVYPERKGSTTLGLAATSVHPATAGVQIPLLKVLLDWGASVDGLAGGWNPVIAALHNGRGDAARYLAKRGARLDLEGAAGTGQLVKRFFNQDGTLRATASRQQAEFGFTWACEYGWTSVVAFLLQRGIDVTAKPHGETGLHWASYGGHAEIVRLLLKRKAPLNIRDKRFGGTPIGWALHGWCYPPPESKRNRYHEVVALLIQAGVGLESIQLDRAQRKKLRGDSRMQKILERAARGLNRLRQRLR